MKLPKVAATTKGLSVGLDARSAVKHGDDMVNLKPFCGAAVGAKCGLPKPPMGRMEVLSVLVSSWRKIVVVVFSARQRSNHLVALFKPEPLRCFGDLLPRFFGVASSYIVCASLSLPLAGFADSTLALFGVSTASERVAFTLMQDVAADDGASFSFASGSFGRPSVKLTITDEALKDQSFLHQDAPLDNGVNSRNNSIRHWCGHGVNPEPSRVGNDSEGATTRGRGYGESYAGNAPKSALPEREEIVWTTRRRVDGGHKQAVDNNQPQDTLTSVRYPWAQDYATVTISLVEEKKNQGRGRLLNLLNQKIDDAEMTIKDLLATQLLATAPAAGSKDPISLTEIVQSSPGTSPSRVASIGNISGTTYSWWRNRATSGGAFSVSDMNTMYNTVSDGSDFPNIGLTSQTVYEYYENSQVGQIRYADTKMADAGFQSLMFKQMPIVWDPLIGITDSLYFLNFAHLKLGVMAGMDFITTDFIEPDNQAAKTAKLLFMGNLFCVARRRQGTLYSITAPA